MENNTGSWHALCDNRATQQAGVKALQQVTTVGESTKRL